MKHTPISPNQGSMLPVQLADGLILRAGTLADENRLADFNARMHSDVEGDRFEEAGYFTHILMRGLIPGTGPADFTIVEDLATGEIVSSLCLIHQDWTYDGIPFGVGQPEIIATHPRYRNRGLVRAQMDVAHRWSAGCGELAQIIMGIPYYYRQFGYETALMKGGGRSGLREQMPRPIPPESEPYCLRMAQDADIPFLLDVQRNANRRQPVAYAWAEGHMRYMIHGRSAMGVPGEVTRIIETAGGEPVGFVCHHGFVQGDKPRLWVIAYELKHGVSIAAVTPSVLRALVRVGDEYAAKERRRCEVLGFYLGETHPIYAPFANQLGTLHEADDMWYVRVTDIPAFINNAAPALETRLAESDLAGFSGALKMNFYRGGIRLVFDDGHVQAQPWKPGQGESEDAAYPDLTFLRVIFGQRSTAEIHNLFSDCWASSQALALIEILFPRRLMGNIWRPA